MYFFETFFVFLVGVPLKLGLAYFPATTPHRAIIMVVRGCEITAVRLVF